MIDPLVTEAFAVVESLEHALSLPVALRTASTWFGRFGLPFLMVSKAASAGEGGLELIASTWPDEAAFDWTRRGGFAADPGFVRMFERRRPIATTAGGPVVGAGTGVILPVARAGRLAGAVSAHGAGPLPSPVGQAVMAMVAPTLFRCSEIALRSARVVKPSPRELECLSLSAHGKSSGSIAQDLGLSEHTVNTHLRSAIEKLAAASRAQAVADAIRRGWID